MADVIGQHAMNKVISPLAEVQAAVEEEAIQIEAKAKALLAPHKAHSDRYDHKSGNHHIERSTAEGKYGSLDQEVSMVGTAPVSLEFGHDDKRTGKHVAGLHIIKKAAGLI